MPAVRRRARKGGPLYVVEHMEEGLEDWCRLEYTHMCEIVPPERLVFLRWPSACGEEAAQALATAAQASGPPRTSPQSLAQLRSGLPPAGAAAPAADAEADAAGTLPLPTWDRICLLDMDAEEALEPSDVVNFDAFLFGGILGNVHEHEDGTYGSDDRTAELRDLRFAQRRHLGPMQMTTDTALLVCHLVLEEARPLAEIPWLDSPDIGEGEGGGETEGTDKAVDGMVASDCVCMEGFRYVARRTTGGDDWEPTLPKGMKELLLKDADNDILGQL